MISLINLTKTYDSRGEEPVTAINNITVEFPDTGLISIVGPSGCGKTTLMNILGGFDRPSGGKMLLDGMETGAFSRHQWDEYRAHRMGFVFQSYNLIEDFTVKENLELPVRIGNTGKESNVDDIVKLAEKFGVENLLEKKANHLSGGQKQRVAILRALIKNPSIVLADEPTGNLDRNNSTAVFEMLRQISQNCLVIVVTHDLELAKLYSDRVIGLSYGEITDDSKPKPLSENDKVIRTPEQKPCELPISFCVQLACSSIKKRWRRFIVTGIMLAITMAMIILFLICTFMNREASLGAYLSDKEGTVQSVYANVEEASAGYLSDPYKKIENGKPLYEFLQTLIGQDNIARIDTCAFVEYGSDSYEATLIGLNHTAGEEYLKETLNENQVVLNTVLADAIGITSETCPCMILINNVAVQAVAIEEFCYSEETQGELICEDSLCKKLYVSFGEAKGLDVVSASGANSLAENEVTFSSTNVENMTLISGSLPEKENEIAVSVQYCQNANLNYENVVGTEYYTYNLRKQEYGNAYWDVINLWDLVGEKVKVVGIVDGESDYYLDTNLYDTLIGETAYYRGNLAFIVNRETLSAGIKSMDSAGIEIADERLEEVYSIWDDFREFDSLFLIGITVIGILTVLQMISAFSFSIKDREHTIGILRSMGVPQKNINFLFTAESMMITVVSEILASVIDIGVIIKINSYYRKTVLGIAKINVLIPKPHVWLACLILLLVVCNLVVYIPLSKMRRREINSLLLES